MAFSLSISSDDWFKACRCFYWVDWNNICCPLLNQEDYSCSGAWWGRGMAKSVKIRSWERKNEFFLTSGIPALHFPDIFATGCRFSHSVASEERRFDSNLSFVLFCSLITLWLVFCFSPQICYLVKSLTSIVAASHVGSGGGSHHPRLALLALAALHTLAAFLTNYSMSQANTFPHAHCYRSTHEEA